MAKKSLIDKIQDRINKAAENKKKLEHLEKMFRIRKGETHRIRFISDFEDVVEVMMHEKYGVIFPTPCGKYFGEDCNWCDLEGVATNEYYAWTVLDRGTSKKKESKLVVFNYKATGASPVPLMVKRYQKYGTLVDRMYEISVTGERWNKTWDLVAEGDKIDWKKSYKPYTKQQVFEYLLKAGGSSEGANGNGDSDDDEDGKPAKKKKKERDEEE